MAKTLRSRKPIRNPHKNNTRTDILYVFIGGNLSEESLSPVPPYKDFQYDFSPIGYTPRENKISTKLCTPYGAEIVLKVLGKEFEEQPFFKRVFLNRHMQISVRVLFLCGYFSGFLLIYFVPVIRHRKGILTHISQHRRVATYDTDIVPKNRSGVLFPAHLYRRY